MKTKEAKKYLSFNTKDMYLNPTKNNFFEKLQIISYCMASEFTQSEKLFMGKILIPFKSTEVNLEHNNERQLIFKS